MNSNYIFCPNCGNKVLKSYNFCPYCRQPLPHNQGAQNVASSYNRPTPGYSNQNRYGYTRTSQPMQNSSMIIRRRITPPKRTFGQAIKLFWVNYVNFNGYSTRAEFWWWFLCEYVVNLIFAVLYIGMMFSSIESSIENIIGNNGMEAGLDSGNNGISLLTGMNVYSIIYVIWILAIIIPNLTLRVRRFRDAGISNGWTITILIIDYLSWIIPFLGWLAWFVARIATIIIECSPSVRSVIGHNNLYSQQTYTR